jgi:peptide chain release factor 1
MIDPQKIKDKYPLDEISKQKSDLEEKLSTAHTNPNIDISALSAELNYITELHTLYTEINKYLGDLVQAKEIIEDGSDKEMIEMAQMEIEDLETKIPNLDKEISKKVIEQKLSDPDDLKSVILEIRAGAGGEEASIFAADIFRMYTNFANTKSWTIDIISSNVSENGGYREVIAKIEGKGAYKHLKYESGVHRVQRIPTTESGGRIHTSTTSVAILPEAKDIDIQIKPEDIRVDTMRSSGAGGQSVNKTDSAIRITHLETGLIVSCQDTKVQQQNKEKAMQILRSRLYERKREEEAQKRSDMRSSQIGQAMRAEKIRTYNYPQSRVTDHRVKLSWHNLEEIMSGEIEKLLTDLNEAILDQLLAELQAKGEF